MIINYNIRYYFSHTSISTYLFSYRHCP